MSPAWVRANRILLEQNLDRRVQFVKVTTVGSTESLAKLESGEVDLAFVQGGVPIPERPDGPDWIVSEIPGEKLILLFVKEDLASGDIKRILTSSEGQGSHSLCRTFADCWGIAEQVSYLHDWRVMTNDESYQVPEDVDAVFVVKDPLNPRMARIPMILRDAGFRLHMRFRTAVIDHRFAVGRFNGGAGGEMGFKLWRLPSRPPHSMNRALRKAANV